MLYVVIKFTIKIKSNKMNEKKNWFKSIYIVLVAVVGLFAIFLSGMNQIFFVYDENNPDNQKDLVVSNLDYPELVKYINNNNVKKVDFYDNDQIAIIEIKSQEINNGSQKIRIDVPNNAKLLITKLKEANVDIDAHPPRRNKLKLFSNTLISLVVPTIVVSLLYILFDRSNKNGSMWGGNGNSNQMLNLRETNAEIQMNPDTGITFNDIAGIDEVKEEFEEIVTFLKTPSRFTVVGAAIPKGVLLVGPPGTGKTLLAKAIAGEAKVPFLNVSGSEFVEMFVGVGASRVRDLFSKAKNNTPCIIFIDEIDAVGRQRGTGIGGGNDEREQTLNQLLTEMDGFEKNKGIIVIAATNRADVLDNALLRPGRFDRQVTVNSPDKNGREAILKIHARNKKLESNISLDLIAQRTPGFGGADLANVLNEAAIIAAREEKKAISLTDINTAIERVIAGLETSSVIDNKNKRLIAYHEVGHAIIGTLLQDHDNVQTVTLIPRGQAKGLTWFIPNEDANLITRSQILSRIIGTLGGRAAEQVVFGDAELTTGASNDLIQVTDMAKQMVTRFGMSPIGPIALGSEGGGFLFVGRGVKPANEYSESLAIKIDTQIKSIVELCYAEAIQIMESNRISLDTVVQKLIEEEVLTGKRFEEIVSNFSKLPLNQIYQAKLSLN
uniref:cell division protein n=1 Tax=Merotricha bacillata TaxID=658122 RepID=UPI0021156B51|nr:cell division protein [Merotricha bacillata]UTE94503.1 cell division protein [Merotricha bacillata]